MLVGRRRHEQELLRASPPLPSPGVPATFSPALCLGRPAPLPCAPGGSGPALHPWLSLRRVLPSRRGFHWAPGPRAASGPLPTLHLLLGVRAARGEARVRWARALERPRCSVSQGDCHLSCRPQVTDEEPSSNHTVMIQETLQQASVELAEQHHLVVSSDDVEGIETVTVYTQGGEPSEFIVYVQEAMQPAEEPPGGQPAPEL